MCRFSRFSGSAKCTAYSIGKFFLNSNVFNSRNSGHSLLSSFGIVPGLFQFTSPGTFALLKSRDDRTTGTSRSLGPVLSSPGTYMEGYLRNLFAKNQFKDICFSIFASFFLAKFIGEP